MGKTLILVRHAQALNAKAGSGDQDRELTERGLRDAKEAGRRLLRRQLIPDGIITSHSVRTTATARIIASEIGFPETSIIQEPRLYNTPEETYFDVIREFETSNDMQLLVGHNFTISHVLYQLAGMRTQEMAPASVAILRLEIGGWSEIRTGCGVLQEFFDPV